MILTYGRDVAKAFRLMHCKSNRLLNLFFQIDTTGGGLDAITACFWIKTEKTTQEPTVLSYAVPQQSNEFLIFFRSLNFVVAWKNGVKPHGATFRLVNVD